MAEGGQKRKRQKAGLQKFQQMTTKMSRSDYTNLNMLLIRFIINNIKIAINKIKVV